MSRRRGFYSIVQFCPDADRHEGVNVGVLLFEVGVGLVRATNLLAAEHLRTRLPWAEVDKERLPLYWGALLKRLRREGIRTPEDIKDFASKDSGDLVLVEPRSVAFESAEAKLDELNARLVLPRPMLNRLPTFRCTIYELPFPKGASAITPMELPALAGSQEMLIPIARVNSNPEIRPAIGRRN